MKDTKHGYTYDPEYVHAMKDEARRLIELFYRQLNGGANQLNGTEHFNAFQDIKTFFDKYK
jgi:hypothetical protein